MQKLTLEWSILKIVTIERVRMILCGSSEKFFRGESRYIIVYHGEQPLEMFFARYSYD